VVPLDAERGAESEKVAPQPRSCGTLGPYFYHTFTRLTRAPKESSHMLEGFKNFVARGNVIDLASGVIIGAAFGIIVDSLSKDVITPVIGIIGGHPDFSAFKLGSIGLGNLVNAVVNFIIKAAGLYFLIVLPFNRYAAKLSPPPTATETSLAQIRDLMKQLVDRTPAR
jgi:large conductance mechanosensitive channel